jgi:Nucleotidyltransferase domain
MSELNFPQIEEPYATAISQAVDYILERFQPVLGIIIAGSVLRGEGDERSDIDTFVIFEGDYRQRVQKLFNGVRFEIFANPPQRVPKYFDDEQKDGTPSTAHMIATGHILFKRSSLIDELRPQAQALLKDKPIYSVDFLNFQRYRASDNFENALDLRERDPAMALTLVGVALSAMLVYYFQKQGKFVPRHKNMLAILRQENPELAHLVEAFWQTQGDERFEIAGKIADISIETRGFYEWETTAEKLSL